MAAGGLPDSAHRRLVELRTHAMTSSFFTAGDAAVASAHEIEAVGQLVGASACRLAVGVIQRTRGPSGRLPLGSAAWRERTGPIQSWTTARQRALARLSEQADLLEADAVLGIRAHFGLRAGEPPTVEVVFTGTAVRTGDHRARGKRTVTLAQISPPEFALLRAGGVEVCGIAGACSAVEVSAGLSTRRALAGRLTGVGNQELSDLTEGVYEARRLAIGRLRRDAARLGATGVIGVALPLSLEDDDPEMGVTIHLLGTAVRGRPRARVDPKVVLSVGDG